MKRTDGALRLKGFCIFYLHRDDLWVTLDCQGPRLQHALIRKWLSCPSTFCGWLSSACFTRSSIHPTSHQFCSIGKHLSTHSCLVLPSCSISAVEIPCLNFRPLQFFFFFFEIPDTFTSFLTPRVFTRASSLSPWCLSYFPLWALRAAPSTTTTDEPSSFFEGPSRKSSQLLMDKSPASGWLLPCNSTRNLLILALKKPDEFYRLVSDLGTTNEAIVLI